MHRSTFDSRISEHTQRSARSRVADQIVRALVDAGVDRVFGIPGGAVSPLFDALIDSEVEVVVAQHEAMAAYMAQGYARATGRPAVVLVTSGPGVLNTTTPVAAARLDEVPLVLLSGDVKATLAGRGSLQDGGSAGLDVLHVMRSLTKHAESTSSAARSVAAVRQALSLAMAHPRGPVFVNVAMDTAASDTGHARFDLGAPRLGAAAGAVCEEIARSLSSATRPVIWVGGGARHVGVGPLLQRIAERTRCPVVCDVESKGLFPESHALSLGLFGVGSSGLAERYFAGGVDLLVTIGARLDDPTTGGFSDLLRIDGRMIQLDHAPERMSRAYAFDHSVLCDLGETVGLIERMTAPPAPNLVLLRDAALREARTDVLVPRVPEADAGPFHPAAAVRMLQQALPKDAVFTSDIGNHLVFAAQHLVLDQADRFHVSQGLGGMGSGIGAAMGLAAGLAGRRVVVGICGDGSFRMVGNELATCAANGIPVVLVVFNDGQLGMVDHGLNQIFGRSGFCRSPQVDYVQWARAMGVEAHRVARARDLPAALAKAGKAPLLIELPIRPDVRARNPRADVLAFPEAPAAK